MTVFNARQTELLRMAFVELTTTMDRAAAARLAVYEARGTGSVKDLHALVETVSDVRRSANAASERMLNMLYAGLEETP